RSDAPHGLRPTPQNTASLRPPSRSAPRPGTAPPPPPAAAEPAGVLAGLAEMLLSVLDNRGGQPPGLIAWGKPAHQRRRPSEEGTSGEDTTSHDHRGVDADW